MITEKQESLDKLLEDVKILNDAERLELTMGKSIGSLIDLYIYIYITKQTTAFFS